MEGTESMRNMNTYSVIVIHNFLPKYHTHKNAFLMALSIPCKINLANVLYVPDPPYQAHIFGVLGQDKSADHLRKNLR